MTESPLDDLPDFTVNGDVDFEPTYYPEKVKPSKERNLNREDGICEGEQVTDTGSKNKSVNIRGYLLESEKDTFWNLLDKGTEHRMVSMPWSGDVMIESGDISGPMGVDDKENEWVYEYTLKVVESDGTDMQNDGIVS